MVDQIELSKRLKTIASYIGPNSFFVDIGSDHAYLPCYVCLKQPNVKVVAGEVNRGPWESAKKTVTQYGLSARIDVRLGDGLEVINEDDQVDTVTIAGMGGSLITNILKSGKSRLENIEQIIAQPNNHSDAVRRFLAHHHFKIVDEFIVEENGHIYEIIISHKATEFIMDFTVEENEKKLLFGPKLMQERSSVFLKKWQAEYKHIQSVIHQMKLAKSIDKDKMAQLERKLQWIEEVLT